MLPIKWPWSKFLFMNIGGVSFLAKESLEWYQNNKNHLDNLFYLCWGKLPKLMFVFCLFVFKKGTSYLKLFIF